MFHIEKNGKKISCIVGLLCIDVRIVCCPFVLFCLSVISLLFFNDYRKQSKAFQYLPVLADFILMKSYVSIIRNNLIRGTKQLI